MNPIQKLLREQKEEFEKKFTAFGNVYADKEAVTKWRTTAQQQLIDVIIEGMRKHAKDEVEIKVEPGIPISIVEMLEQAVTRAINQTLAFQITLLEEAKKNL